MKEKPSMGFTKDCASDAIVGSSTLSDSSSNACLTAAYWNFIAWIEDTLASQRVTQTCLMDND